MVQPPRTCAMCVSESLPPFLWGYTRDIRVVWVLEECGFEYEPIGLDIMFTCVLREIRKTEILGKYLHVEEYRHRCEERPAFVKVLSAYEDRLGIRRGSAR